MESGILNSITPLDFPGLRDALCDSQQTVQEPTIDTTDSGRLVDFDTEITAIGDLSSFTALINLDVTGPVLWGDDEDEEMVLLSSILPNSLETLTIKNEWDEFLEQVLNRLSLDCTAYLPTLRRISASWRPAPRVEAEYLSSAFSQANVNLVLDVSVDDD
ncbi:hypothetical protein ACN47E_004355 [Coniothyrium glycines]